MLKIEQLIYKRKDTNNEIERLGWDNIDDWLITLWRFAPGWALINTRRRGAHQSNVYISDEHATDRRNFRCFFFCCCCCCLWCDSRRHLLLAHNSPTLYYWCWHLHYAWGNFFFVEGGTLLSVGFSVVFLQDHQLAFNGTHNVWLQNWQTKQRKMFCQTHEDLFTHLFVVAYAQTTLDLVAIIAVLEGD